MPTQGNSLGITSHSATNALAYEFMRTLMKKWWWTYVSMSLESERCWFHDGLKYIFSSIHKISDVSGWIIYHQPEIKSFGHDSPHTDHYSSDVTMRSIWFIQIYEVVNTYGYLWNRFWGHTFITLSSMLPVFRSIRIMEMSQKHQPTKLIC